MANIDMDKIVNYQREYAGAIEKPQVSGSRLTGLCPFHADKNASFSADLKTGRYNCFACGASGNYIDFVANRFGMDTKEAYKKILADYGIAEQEKPKEKVSDTLYNVEIYAEEKKLPADWLAKTFSLSAGKEHSGQHYVKIPYFNEDCQPVVFRKRYPKDAPMRFKWSQGSAGKLMLYGLWSLKTVRERGYVILVEGESDTHTLWYLGLPALGVPGASTYRPEWSEKLKGLKLYLHIEPDQGGKTFLEQMTKKLRDGGFTGEVYTWSCDKAGVKDPSALFMEKGKDEAKAYIEAALKDAKKIDIYDIPEAIKGAPVRLRQPDGWKFSEQGINMIDAKTFESKCICRTPILLTRRLKSSETGDEKIEIAFLRDGQWKYVSKKRSEIFQAKSIVSLADEGCTITSENAKYVVRFLQALEEENIDIIEVVESTSSFGWQTRNRFLPGHADGLVLDIDPSTRGWAASYCMNGSLKGWIDMIDPLRENDRFRFILAGSFAAPLLRILKQRIFFIYNWGGSKGGKAQPLYTKIITPEGSKTMGEIMPGDRVIGCDGKAHEVLEIFPQGVKPIYELTFEDGTKTRCSEDHLWTVSTRCRREKGRGYTVMKLSEMLQKPLKSNKGYNFRIPVCKAVEYEVNPKLKIPPYLLGLLIGDGCLTLTRGQLYFNNSEDDIVKKLNDELKKFGGHSRYNPYSTNQYQLFGCSDLKEAIRDYHLDVKSPERFIPEEYKTASIKDRMDLLKGLMDTDGNVSIHGGSFKYSTASERLASDVVELCRSLGFRANAITKHHLGKSDEYSVTISTDEPIFTSSKHFSRMQHYGRKTDKTSMAITNIKYVGEEECKCILVDSKEHTYLCDDFIVTHNTAAIKAALSAWGDPEGLMTSFNSTQVGLERAAAFFSDLPMGIDERQLAGQKQESLEKLVYMLASGQGKLRGAKTGGIQAMNIWKTVILASGEEPILRETSQTGVGTRMIELIGAPFDSEDAARAVHLKASDNCGWAGPAFMSYVLEQGDDFIISMYEDILSLLQDDTKMSGAHIASIAAVTVADILAGEAIFNKENLAENTERALAMARHIAKDIKDNEPPDVNVSALNFILDWMNMNSVGFTEDARERLGFVDPYGNVCVFPTALRTALEKEGFSSRKTIKYLMDEGYIQAGEKDGRRISTPLKKFNGKPCRVLCFLAAKLENEGYQLDFIEVDPGEAPEF